MTDIMRMGEKNPNYLGSYDLYDMPGQEMTLTIADIRSEAVVSSRGEEVVTVCVFAEDVKPMILNPTNKKRLSRLFHTKDVENMKGKKVTVTVERTKAFGGKLVDALRIKETLPVDPKAYVPPCAVCGGKIEKIGSLNALQASAYTKKKYGVPLCAACATQKAKELKEGTESGA